MSYKNKISRKQVVSSLLFAVGLCGIDYTIKENNNTFHMSFADNTGRIIVYYVILFILAFLLAMFVYGKMNRNRRGE